TNGPVYCMAAYQGELYVGGKFTTAGGSPAVNIAKWNGSTWSAVGNGLTNNNNFCSERVSALMVYSNALYAGGCFTSEGNNIAKWDGNAWSTLGTGTDAPVDALQSFNNYLYVGGGFTNVNSSLCQYLAKWNGNWTNANTNINMSPWTFKVIGNKLFVAGFGFPNSSLFKLNGNAWNVVQSGIPAAAFSPAHGIYAIDFFSHHLYLGGLFKMASNEYGDHLIYTSDTFLGVNDHDEENAFGLFPNPSSGSFTLDFEREVNADRRLEISNSLGQTVYASSLPRGRTSFEVQGLSEGIYLVRIISANGASARKLVIE
ncbi:MAG TPA: T9SS type A sorting domain-containing protein, partial [Bacteroidia bacterium]